MTHQLEARTYQLRLGERAVKAGEARATAPMSPGARGGGTGSGSTRRPDSSRPNSNPAPARTASTATLLGIPLSRLTRRDCARAEESSPCDNCSVVPDARGEHRERSERFMAAIASPQLTNGAIFVYRLSP